MQLDSILSRLQISDLNAMQHEVLNQYDTNKDFLLLSPTGTGKTLAFTLLLLKELEENTNAVQCLIVVPTRELALQIETVVRKVIQGYKVTCVYGGHDTKVERNNLKEAPAILIGTPGRIIYHLDRNHFDPETVKTIILDEFDKSLEYGFQDQMTKIIDACTSIRKRILTSATEMTEIPDFVRINDKVSVNFLNEASSKPDISYKKITSTVQRKLISLFNLICKLQDQKILVFCNHRDAVEHISELLENREIIHDVFHGGLEQEDRELALLKFRNKSNHILLTTDLASRGLDIPEVDAIIHYQLPAKEDDFIHRNGRTARMLAKGTVYVLLKPEDNYSYLPEIIDEEELDRDYPLPPSSKYATVYVSAGKKNKVNKIDLVGYFLSIDGIHKDDIGIIEVKDYESFVAVNRKIVASLIQTATNGKIKGKKIRVGRT
ncbi:DEAD/DEAH box helicase [Sphingobacterium hungaricum]